MLLIGCVSSGRPWIPPKETPQAAQAWEKTKNPELKIEWIFIDEQFVEVKNSTLPDLSESDRDKFMVPDSFKPQPQRFLGESEEIPQSTHSEKNEQRWSAYYFIYSTIPVKKSDFWYVQIGNLSRSKDVWSKQINNRQDLRVSCKDQEVKKIEVYKNAKFIRANFSRELDPSDSGLPSLNETAGNLASWICLHSNNLSHPN